MPAQAAMSIGTANFIHPKASIEIIKGLKDYLLKNKIKDINFTYRLAKGMNQKPKLILALDVDNHRQALRFVNLLYPKVKIFKVGLQLYAACGPKIIEDIRKPERKFSWI